MIASNVEALFRLAFAGRNAVVDSFAIFSAFSSHGLVAIPASFTANFLFSHCD